jgi:hypothetical protein
LKEKILERPLLDLSTADFIYKKNHAKISRSLGANVLTIKKERYLNIKMPFKKMNKYVQLVYIWKKNFCLSPHRGKK